MCANYSLKRTAANRLGVNYISSRQRPLSSSVSHMTPAQEAARKKQLVSAAKALLSLQVGIAVGCIRVDKLLFWLRLHEEKQFQVFRQFFTATAGLPIGNERLLWATDALLQQDAALAKLEAKFRPAILQACVKIVSAYG